MFPSSRSAEIYNVSAISLIILNVMNLKLRIKNAQPINFNTIQPNFTHSP